MTTQIIQNYTDEQLVAQFQATKDNRLIGEIYNRYLKKVFHTCLGIVKNREVANDLKHDVMLKVIEKLPTLRHGHLLGLWIHRIAKNQSIDFCKARQKRPFVPLNESFHTVKEETNIEAMLDKEALLNSMEALMNGLKEDTRIILNLKYVNNCSIKDLQKQLGLSESAVKMRLSRARTLVINLYQKEQQRAAV